MALDTGDRTKVSYYSYQKVSLDDLSILTLNDEEERNKHLKRIDSLNLVLPFDGKGSEKEFHLWKAWSIWPQRHVRDDEKYFCLHPELVEKDDKEIELETTGVGHSARMCSNSLDSVKHGKVPQRSIRAGIDYGSYWRVGLEPLSLMECHIVSKCRHYSQVVKIESNTGRQR